jgi:hypothetical protein
MAFDLKGAAKGRPKYLRGREEMLQQRILASSSICGTSFMATNSNFWRLTFNSEMALKHKKM